MAHAYKDRLDRIKAIAERMLSTGYNPRYIEDLNVIIRLTETHKQIRRKRGIRNENHPHP